MTIALVDHTYWASGSDGGTTGAINTTGASLLLLHLSEYVGSTHSNSVSDSKGNTGWVTSMTAYQGDGYPKEQYIKLYYVANPTVGSGHTFTYSGTSFESFYVAAFSGVATASPLDQTTGNAPTDTSAQTVQPGSITPSEGNCLVVSGFGGGNGTNTYTINSSYTLLDRADYVGPVYEGGALAYIVQTSASATNPTWDCTVNGSRAALIASFKSAAGGGGGGSTFIGWRSLVGVGI